MNEPILNPLFSDNGELCGWSLINRDTGETLCSEEDAEKIASLESQLREKQQQMDFANDYKTKTIEEKDKEIERLKIDLEAYKLSNEIHRKLI